MRKNEVILALVCAVTSCPACGLILDFDPPDPTFQSVDGSTLDGGMSGDSGTGHLDGSFDDGSILADADAGHLDGDVAPDAERPDSGPPDPCETYPGLCLRFTDMSTSPVSIMSYWLTYAQGDGTSVEDWRAIECVGGVMVIDRTSVCLVPETERETGRMAFHYASYTTDGSRSVCNGSGCPRENMEAWVGGAALAPTDISQDRGWSRPPLPPSGMTFVFAMTMP